MQRCGPAFRAALGPFLFLSLCFCASLPGGYKGKPFQDEHHRSGPQTIPGTVQCALYDLGGEGVAYHDTDAINKGSGDLNHHPNHCRPGTPEYICYFREKEGVDISYTKDFADFNHPNLVTPEKDQLYIGWAEDGEWVNYTVRVKSAGTYSINAMYSDAANTVTFSVNNRPAGECKFPVDTGSMHKWNKAVNCGEIAFPHAGRQLLTLHYKKGNNLAYFEFAPGRKK